MAYIDRIERMLVGTEAFFAPTSEIQAAYQVLSRSPVPHYPPFIEPEVRLLGAYRAFVTPYAQEVYRDEVWVAMVEGEWYAWIYAIHEIEELAAFEREGIQPLVDRVQWSNFLSQAHREALLAELRFLRA